MISANFDRLARAYRWLEYLTLGRTLERTRTFHLPALPKSGRALLLGDGDGRFTAALLRACPDLVALAVDGSAAMLRQTQVAADYDPRLRTLQADVRALPAAVLHSVPAWDLVVTHFLLDCLTQSETDELIGQVARSLAPDSSWLVSEFRIPPGILHLPARAYVGLLYLAFRILTGLRVRHVPDFASSMHRAGLVLTARHRFAFGLLTTELWSPAKQ